MKIYIASFNRASNGAISKLKQKMIDNEYYTDNYREADYILACGDRKETFDFVLEQFRENKKIIHLWAGELSQGTHDEVYRHAITLMSKVQLCTNEEAKKVVKNLCKSIKKKYLVFTIGNIMLDNLEIDESLITEKPYDLILYNPPTELSPEEIQKELDYICSIKDKKAIWMEPNGDINSSMIYKYVTNSNLPRPKFLGLLKNCNRFITNSSCQYYEASFLLKPEQIIPIGKRNKERNSKYSNMSIPNASDNVIKILRFIDNAKI
jgi:UDP-N-acetylglucosamine 2-epimerase